MDMDESGKSKYNLADSAMEAFSFGNLLKRVFLFLVFGVLLGLKELVSNLDKTGASGGGAMNYFWALYDAMMAGVGKALGSMWLVVTHPVLYYQTAHWGSILFSVFSIIVLLMFFYQPVSLIINFVDGKRGQATGMLLRLFVTLVIVLILSVITFYATGGTTITTPILNETAKNVTQSVIDTTNTSSVISLL